MDINLEKEMHEDAIVIAYLKDEKVATDFYRALCNVDWKKDIPLTEEEKVIDKLKGRDSNTWSCSWRYAGGIIADIRNKHYNKNENYMDYYCAGNEGIVTDLVEECFERMGWTPIIL